MHALKLILILPLASLCGVVPAFAGSSHRAGTANAKFATTVVVPESNGDKWVAKDTTASKNGMRSLIKAGVPQPVIAQVTKAFVYDSDPKVHGVLLKHAVFHVVYEEIAGSQAPHRHPDMELRLAAVTISGKEHFIYRYPIRDGAVAFVDNNGRGVVPLDLDSPLPGAPITSPFGWRIHPILEIREFHKGVDFGAPTGTPVRAARDGTIEDIGLRGNYGNYLRLRHSDRLETAYAHLDGFAPGLHAGSHVNRDQIIAYVGATGLATGPHLYYEVIVDGRRLNPLRRNLAVRVKLAGTALRHFQQFISLLRGMQPPLLGPL